MACDYKIVDLARSAVHKIHILRCTRLAGKYCCISKIIVLILQSDKLQFTENIRQINTSWLDSEIILEPSIGTLK